MNHVFRSTWGALLWKEWRQQRLAALFLGLFCVIAHFTASTVMESGLEAPEWMALLSIAFGCLGAASFGTESDDRTAEFVSLLPIPARRILNAKYTMAMGLAFSCLLLPSLFLQPDLGVAFDSITPEAMHGAVGRTVASVACASTIIALSGALAGGGLGAMGTFLASLVVFSVSAGLFLTVGMRLASPTFGPQTCILAGVVPSGVLGHVWMIRTWSRRRRTRSAWRILGGMTLLALSPTLCAGIVLVAYRWSMFPKIASALNEDMRAVPSPDGHTIALTSSRYGGPRHGAYRTWLLDVDTGKMRGIAPWWRDSKPPAQYLDGTDWSPDGRFLLTHSNSIFALPSRMQEQVMEPTRETVWELTQDGLQVVQANIPASAPTTRWLGDGTMAVHGSGAWEFTDLGTGEVRRCLYPADGGTPGHSWHDGERFALERGIASIYIEGGSISDSPVLHYWLSSPDLPRTERRRITLPRGMTSRMLSPTPSTDGKWVLLSTPERQAKTFLLGTAGTRSFWLVSPVDGSCDLLAELAEAALADPFFTPDSKLLVMPTSRALRIWNVPERRWEPEVPLPAIRQSIGFVICQGVCSFAVSPRRPWRVAMAVGKSEGVYVMDLAEQTSTRAFSGWEQGVGSAAYQEVSWLGGDRLLISLRYPCRLWLSEADGSGSRQLLP